VGRVGLILDPSEPVAKPWQYLLKVHTCQFSRLSSSLKFQNQPQMMILKWLVSFEKSCKLKVDKCIIASMQIGSKERFERGI
jgi:hypothetical protein